MLKLIEDRLIPLENPQPLMLEFADRNELRQSYMPNFIHGGLFIPLAKPLPPGSKVLLVLDLPGEPNRRTVKGVVGYRCPVSAGANNPAGIGVAFDGDEQCATLKRDIEKMLTGMSREARSFSF